MALELVYETHAITTDNEAGFATGWNRGELSPRGRESAMELGRRRRDDGIDVIYVSDLGRAVDTARIAFEGSPIPVIEEPRLRECNYGEQNGMATELHGRLRISHVEVPWPGGESYRDVAARTAELLEELAMRHDGGRILWISHSACKFALDHLLLGRDLTDVVAHGMDWQPGWEIRVPSGWVAPAAR
jgi:broad specificity phosphatase PhoE